MTAQVLAARLMKIELEECDLIGFGRRLGEEEESGETVGELAWTPLGAVDP